MRKVLLLIAPLLISSFVFSLASEPPSSITLFADAAWYRQAEAKEQTYEGVLQRLPSPMATSGRWNPVRLFSGDPKSYPIYLGSDYHRLAPYLGRRVRLEGKLVEVLQQQEIWPARLTPIDSQAVR